MFTFYLPVQGRKIKVKWHGTAGGPGGRDRTLAVKSRKKRLKKGEKQWPSYAWRMQAAWAKILQGTPGGPGGREQTLAVKSRKKRLKIF